MNRHLVVPAACLAALVAGCGSSSSSSTTGSPATSGSSTSGAATGAQSSAPAAGAGALTVAETEYKLSPASPKVKGGSVQIAVKNAGAVTHALEIENAGPGGGDLKSTPVKAGATTTVTANLKPGKTYEWYCPIANHRALGMKGTITVLKSQASSSTPPASSTPSTGASGGASSSGGGY